MYPLDLGGIRRIKPPCSWIVRLPYASTKVGVHAVGLPYVASISHNAGGIPEFNSKKIMCIYLARRYLFIIS